ncbi:hypothetical protein B0H16DRAFT_1741046 [Mycena metata]|uniref:Uncharacterized protein n=1 Tax=Mycena metata TaxID=1033252 RepID=A0AAD7MGP2_9AGAR|nr:hypothetical protein B0H16DRAFT_1741046 [Mycena metata]
MAGHNSRSASSQKAETSKKTPTVNSRSRDARRLACAKYRLKNEEELKEKARERILRSKAFDDPELAKTQAAMRCAHDATYREKHRKSIQFKATLRLFDAQWKKHAGPPPHPRDKRDFTQEFEWFQEDRKAAMAAHFGTGR